MLLLLPPPTLLYTYAVLFLSRMY